MKNYQLFLSITVILLLLFNHDRSNGFNLHKTDFDKDFNKISAIYKSIHYEDEPLHELSYSLINTQGTAKICNYFLPLTTTFSFQLNFEFDKAALIDLWVNQRILFIDFYDV